MTKPEAAAHPLMALAANVPEAEHGGAISRFLDWLRGHNYSTADVAKVGDAINEARAGGVSWLQILLTLAPFILTIFTGGKVDIQAMIAAILALLNPTP